MTELAQVLILGALIGGVYALLASGLTLIFGVMGVINIAHGALLILAAFVTYSLWSGLGLDPLLSIVIVAPAMLGLGLALYKVTIGRIRGAPASASVLLTFGLALVLEGVMGSIWGNSSTAVRPSYFNQSFSIGALYLPKAQVYGGLVAIAVLAGLYAILNRTWLGRAIRASSVNPQGAELVGVSVASVSALTFAIGVATVGAGGSIVSVLYPFLPGSHYRWIASLLAIIVVGGMGSLPGAYFGSLALGLTETLTVTYVSPRAATVVPFIFVFVVLLVRPQGLLGVRMRQDVAPA